MPEGHGGEREHHEPEDDVTPQTMSEIITGLDRDGLLERRMLAGLSAKDEAKLRDLMFQCVAQRTEGREERAG